MSDAAETPSPARVLMSGGEIGGAYVAARGTDSRRMSLKWLETGN
jgi:hypothetical protein